MSKCLTFGKCSGSLQLMGNDVRLGRVKYNKSKKVSVCEVKR